MVSILKASICLTIRATTIVPATMVREMLKLSFLLVLLIQFQTASYHFLHAGDMTMSSGLLTNLTKITPKGYLIREKVSQVSHYPPHLSGSVSKSWKKLSTFLKFNNHSTINGVSVKNFATDQGWGEDDEDPDGPIRNENYDDQIIQLSTKMNPEQLFLFEQKLLKLLEIKKRSKSDQERSRIRQNKAPNLNLSEGFAPVENTIRSFYHAGQEVELEGLHSHLMFDITSLPFNEKITRAELRVPFAAIESMTNTTFKIQVLVHDIVKIQPKKKGSKTAQPISYPIDTKTLTFKTGESSNHFWLSFDVFPAFSRRNVKHYKEKRRLIGLGIEFVIQDGRRLSLVSEKVQNYVRVRRSPTSRVIPIPTNETFASSTKDQKTTAVVPTLLTYSEDGGISKKLPKIKTLSRRYRSHQNRNRRRNHRIKNRKRNLCSRKKMFVDFVDVGWNDWIVAPPGYQAFFCSGSCPFPMAEHLNATNHAVIQALVNSMNPRLVPPPCCVPTKYSSLSLLYTDSSDRIVLKNYKEMIVESCGCS